ncbi:DgyrCDS3510 [Dimorphilus gyrociliatus]|nr:DgyrCDS3510 [Dimorphilus gyrociliatus]
MIDTLFYCINEDVIRNDGVSKKLYLPVRVAKLLDALPLEFVGLGSVCLLRRLVRTRQIKIKKKRRARYSLFSDGPFTDENLVKIQAKLLGEKLGKLIENICSDIHEGKSPIELSQRESKDGKEQEGVEEGEEGEEEEEDEEEEEEEEEEEGEEVGEEEDGDDEIGEDLNNLFLTKDDKKPTTELSYSSSEENVLKPMSSRN